MFSSFLINLKKKKSAFKRIAVNMFYYYDLLSGSWYMAANHPEN